MTAENTGPSSRPARSQAVTAARPRLLPTTVVGSYTQHGWDRAVGFGVIDVKTAEVESPALVASRIRRVLEYVPPERLVINPDCGLRHLPAEVARAKLRAMVAGAALVREEITRQHGSSAGPQRPGARVAPPGGVPAAPNGNGSVASAGQAGPRSPEKGRD